MRTVALNSTRYNYPEIYANDLLRANRLAEVYVARESASRGTLYGLTTGYEVSLYGADGARVEVLGRCQNAIEAADRFVRLKLKENHENHTA